MKKIKPRFGADSTLYAFTTENLSGCLPLLAKGAKRALAVCGSGDQAINLALFGVEKICLFDINPHALMFSQLKLLALCALSFGEFKSFFLRHAPDGRNPNPAALAHRLYLRLRPDLTRDCRVLFDALYQRHSNDGAALRNSGSFNNQYDKNELKIASNPYLASPQRYLCARTALRRARIEWIHSSLCELPQRLRSKYDLILLSNIADYARELFPSRKSYLAEFAADAVKPLLSLLSKSGVIAAAYVYEGDRRMSRPARSQIDLPAFRQKVFEDAGFSFHELIFRGVIPGRNDSVIILSR